jgi:hypothetical protein
MGTPVATEDILISCDGALSQADRWGRYDVG